MVSTSMFSVAPQVRALKFAASIIGKNQPGKAEEVREFYGRSLDSKNFVEEYGDIIHVTSYDSPEDVLDSSRKLIVWGFPNVVEPSDKWDHQELTAAEIRALNLEA